jgi:hypothetical protein
VLHCCCFGSSHKQNGGGAFSTPENGGKTSARRNPANPQHCMTTPDWRWRHVAVLEIQRAHNALVEEARVGGSENRMKSPNTKVKNTSHKNCERETKNLQKSVLASTVVNSFTRALAPPFIGRRRDFYIPKIPSKLRNIPSVNMYMNVFYISWLAGLISYIYKPATSSHAQLGLLR